MSDLFLSYAHVDKHWVDTFATLLEQRVNQYVGRVKPDRLWKDNRLIGSQSFSPEIHEQLGSAHCLVACLSSGYFTSEWCIRELTEFSQRVEDQAGCIFCIELDELAIYQKPDLTTHMLGYRFWYQDNLSKRSYPLSDGEPAYETMLIDLAKDIAKALNTRKHSITKGNNQHVPKPRWSQMKGANFEEITQEQKSENSAPLIIRRDRLLAMLSRLEEQYDLETREDERMRIEKVIADKQATLNQIEAQLIR